MKTKLIIVDGHSSVGKSSVSKSIFHQINQTHAAYWLHEECENHPIRHDEFSFGELDTAEGMELNRLGMLNKWTAFRESIKTSGKICITEGCLLHAYDRYFIHSLWNEAQIASFFSQILEVISELNPLIVFLYRPDLRKSLEKAFVARGKWWQDLILRKDDQHIYFKNHRYVDDNSMFEAIAFEQMKMLEIFDQLACPKVKLDTSTEQWDEVVQEVVSLLQIPYQKAAFIQCDMKAYLGRYRWQKGTEADNWIINYDESNDCLYTSLFWPYMPMRCIAENKFELISFPAELHFTTDKSSTQFIVRGNYDWEYNDQIFIRF